MMLDVLTKGREAYYKGAAAQVVGWPPVSQNRWNALTSRGKFVKVAVTGSLYQHKVDLEAYAGYDQLLAALRDKFTSHFTVRRRVGNEEMALVDVVSGAEYVPTYEDKDGDWMLVGDVPGGKGGHSHAHNHPMEKMAIAGLVLVPALSPCATTLLVPAVGNSSPMMILCDHCAPLQDVVVDF